MLCMSRRKSESVVITVPPSPVPREIRVMVIDAAPGKPRLGFTADKDVAIDREEIHDKKKRERDAPTEEQDDAADLRW